MNLIIPEIYGISANGEFPTDKSELITLAERIIQQLKVIQQQKELPASPLSNVFIINLSKVLHAQEIDITNLSKITQSCMSFLSLSRLANAPIHNNNPVLYLSVINDTIHLTWSNEAGEKEILRLPLLQHELTRGDIKNLVMSAINTGEPQESKLLLYLGNDIEDVIFSVKVIKPVTETNLVNVYLKDITEEERKHLLSKLWQGFPKENPQPVAMYTEENHILDKKFFKNGAAEDIINDGDLEEKALITEANKLLENAQKGTKFEHNCTITIKRKEYEVNMAAEKIEGTIRGQESFYIVRMYFKKTDKKKS